jgi:hypothetical protein
MKKLTILYLRNKPSLNLHFAWCALVALRTVQQDGQALSPLSMHLSALADCGV